MDVPNDVLNPSVTASTTIRALKDITFGSIAGMVSKVFEHPFDLTKVRLQSQVLDSSARFNGPIDCLHKTWRNEGFRGLYRGLPAPIVGAMAENASLFMSYRVFRQIIQKITNKTESEKPSLSEIVLAAAGAGAVTSFALTPIELVKCKMQVQMLVSPTTLTTPPPGPVAVLTSVVRSTGIRGLWLGHTGTLIRETGGTAAWFGTKEFVAFKLVQRRARLDPSGSDPHTLVLTPLESGLSGACAGAAFNLILFPADTVKSAIQTEEELRPRHAGNSTPRPTFFGTLKAMYKAQGVRGLYAGCGITVARSIPSSAIIFLIYDELNKHFG
ncbi:mitochondrial ornithine carrier protein [Moniliophthora roreri MCA 2997]|uniref:Mitochondrial ornithine carrier protein n=1 Tax=Moniliophthora roreri (strain MCA 2997) TaxID=1381753 RepID=V2WL76_MONRO|nr:mitochondrial ornithine carrier protein [Moniliophthora roreri MCA 2997]